MKELYEQKIVYLQRYIEFTKMQTEYLKKEEFDKLSEVLDKRQELMYLVDQVDNQITRLFDTISDLDLNSDPVISPLKKDIGLLLKAIIELDEQNGKTLNEEFIDLKQKIAEVNNKRSAQRAYANYTGQNTGYFIDNKK